MKKIALLLASVLMATSAVSCGGKSTGGTTQPETSGKVAETQTEAPEKRKITVSTKFVEDEQTAKTLVQVVEAINERSNGSLELELFTSGVLPIGKDGLEQVASGADWILVDGVNFLGDYVPDYNAITGPFLYTTFDEYLAMTETDLVKDLNQKIEDDFGIKVISVDWILGFRSMMTNKAITTPDDMKGLNIRVPTSQLYTYTIEAMGGNPVSMPYPDTYAALQQGVIDGVEGSILTYYDTQQYENVKEYSLTNHILGVSAVTVSTKLWDSLTDEQRTIITEEFEKGEAYNLGETIESEVKFVELLKAEGVNFHEVDSEAFAKAVEPVYTKFPQWTPGIYEKIMAELEIIRAEQ